MMRTKLKLNPGQRGTKKLLREYGEQLVCVRYRYDEQRKKRFKTVELIVDTVPWAPQNPSGQPHPDESVHIQIGESETLLCRRIKDAKGRWNLNLKLWSLPYQKAIELGLQDRIVW